MALKNSSAVRALDISKHQGTFNAPAAKAQGIEMVICRAAYGTAKDTQWDTFAPAVRAAGMALGAYGFLTAHYLSKAAHYAAADALMRQQVQVWIELCKAQGCKVLAIDQELEGGQKMALNKACNTELLQEAAVMIRDAGLQPLVYASASWVLSYIDWAAVDVDFWVAYYPAQAAGSDFGLYGDGGFPTGRYGNLLRELRAANKLFGWQYGSTGWGRKYGAASANIDRNWVYKKEEEKPMEWKKIEGKQLRCTSGAKPTCEMFSEPSVYSEVLGALALGETCEVLAEEDTVTLAGMTATWYKIAWEGSEVYCLALPDRCVVEDKPIPAPEPAPEPEVPGGNVRTLAGLTEPQAMLLDALAALWGVAVGE